tara:strand:+ start:360 stop:485 length:126 start_codon:yes stop_codon:yes gene_type:complete
MLFFNKRAQKINKKLFTNIYEFSPPDIIAAGENPDEVLTII